jgi:hypothetical protein
MLLRQEINFTFRREDIPYNRLGKLDKLSSLFVVSVTEEL